MNKRSFEFGEFRLQADEKILLHAGKAVALTPKAVHLLLVLVENHGRVVSKEELMQTIWADSFVEESNLTFTISLLRKALGAADKQNLRFIETVPKRGYRFVADVREIEEKNEAQIQNSVSSKPKKYLIPAVLGVLLIGLITIAWYTGSRNSSKTALILSEPFSLEKLSTDGKSANAVISPNGKTAVYSSGIGNDNQSIWLRQLDSGTNVELIPPAAFNHHGFVFSPDGTFIYFNRRPLNSNNVSGVYRVSIFGGVPQKIIERSYSQIGISPDGAQISFVRCDRAENDYCAVWIADAKDGSNEKKIASSSKPNRISSPTFSPDGKLMVYAVGQSENAANEFGLVELNIETGVEREFTAEKFFDIRKIAWLPDKSGVLITASRIPNRNFRLWFVSGTEITPLTKDSESYHGLSLDNAGASIVSTHVKPDFQLKLFQIDNPVSSSNVLADASSASFAANNKIFYLRR